MADSEPSNTNPTPQIAPNEMSGLAARLRARAESVLLRDQPEQQSDMRTAARLIEQLVHLRAEIRRAADSTEDEATRAPPARTAGGTVMPCHQHPDDIPASATPMIISESDTHVVLAVEIAKATLVGYRRLFEQLIEAAGERESPR